MSLDLWLLALLAGLGACAGFLAGLLGVGGGMLVVPFVTAILEHRGVAAALAVKMAIATSMSTIVFTSMSSVRAHHRRGTVRWDLVRGLAPGIVGGSLLASAGVFSAVKGSALAVFFALFVGLSATQMLRSRTTVAKGRMPGQWGQAAIGAVIGFVSGLVGAGGAFISVPFMTRRDVPIHQAVATSAALGFPIALANTVGYVVAGWSLPAALPGSVGYLYLPALAAVAACSVTTAPLGARVAHRLNVAQLRRAFALLLYALAAYMLSRALVP
jgi:uncharacterized membrane protein YfcA